MLASLEVRPAVRAAAFAISAQYARQVPAHPSFSLRRTQRSFGRPPSGSTHSQRIRQSSSSHEPCFTCAAGSGSIVLPQEGPEHATISSGLAGAMASLWGLLFYLTTLALSVPLFIVMLIQAPFVLVLDKQRRLLQHHVNNIWAKISTFLFYKVQIEGKDNLPRKDEPAVYVANHLSQLDIYTLFHLDRPFKFISKTSNFFIPIVGWSMFLTGHVMLNRTDRKSQLQCLLKCGELLQQGCSVLFFPEGTRSKDGRMQEFKKGAFSVAAKSGVPVVPVTLIGTNIIQPNGQESKVYPGTVRVIVHPRVQPSKDANAMMKEAQDKIASALP